MTANEIHDATELAAMVARREASPLELVDAAIARIERLNPKLNAVVTPMFERARERARGDLPQGPFRGVPFLLKDLGPAYAGVRMTAGSAFLADYVPDFNSELTCRLERAGLVIVGKTNTPELGIVPTTESRFLGRCKSPWDTSLSTGGSSGGAAASVASGMVPMAHANDGGGSIRIPASACGVFGLKPTRARTPLGPKVGDVMNGLVCDHAVTRTVRDSAALLDAIEGPDAGDPYWAPPKARPFASEIGADPGKLRIAISVTSPFGSPVHADCVAAAEETAKLCESLGHHVEQAAPEIEGWALMQSFMAVWTSGVAMSVEGYSRILGRSPGPADLEPLTRAYCEMGKAVHAHEYLLAIVHLQQVSRRVAAFMQRYDVWLTPTTGDIAPRLGELDAPDDNPTASGARIAQFVPFTALANITGQPAMSVPLVWNGAGLPVGSQFFGRFGDEATLFRLASQLEQARPWRHRVPSL